MNNLKVSIHMGLYSYPLKAATPQPVNAARVRVFVCS